jgi:hypothetical protein
MRDMLRRIRNFLTVRLASAFDYLLTATVIIVACASILNVLGHFGD